MRFVAIALGVRADSIAERGRSGPKDIWAPGVGDHIPDGIGQTVITTS
jgi:hypothetical protein